MPSPSLSLSTKPHHRKPTPTTTTNHHSSTSPLFCRNSPTATATLDLLILILVLFSGTFLITSYFSYIFNSLSLLLPPQFPLFSLLSFAVAAAVAFEFCCGGGRLRWRRCRNPKCKGMKKAMEFDLQLQTEECLKARKNNGGDEIDKLGWKGGSESNPDYECLRAELRKMAPPNGRAVLLFRAKCGCPVSKLIGWAPKKARKHKKAISSVTVNGDHR